MKQEKGLNAKHFLQSELPTRVIGISWLRNSSDQFRKVSLEMENLPG